MTGISGSYENCPKVARPSVRSVSQPVTNDNKIDPADHNPGISGLSLIEMSQTPVPAKISSKPIPISMLRLPVAKRKMPIVTNTHTAADDIA